MAVFEELMACPRCDAHPLTVTAEGLLCKSCKNTYPLLDNIPFLFPEPAFSLGEWRERLNRLLMQFEYDGLVIKQELTQSKLLAPTRKRLQHMADSYKDQVLRLQQLLAPLAMMDLQASLEAYIALRTRLPQSQGLTTYYANMHRDWCWGDVENALALEQVQIAMASEPLGKVLVLGAGAGRLAYDIHQSTHPELTVALDINPLLLLSAQKIMHGETVHLYEFPIAPKSIEETAILRELSAPALVNEGFHFVLADALHPPFAPESFDTIITPWLLDILPEDLHTFATRINRLLKPGGRWLNFGSLAFSHANISACYSLEEVSLITEEVGFGDFQATETSMPYMQSPASRHGRQEQVITFHTKKYKKASRPKRYQSLPEWIIKTDTPVPQLQTFQVQTMATRIHAFIMALIDGNRSVKDMALMLEQQRLMPRQEAEPAIQSFLIKMHEEQLTKTNF